MSEPTIVAAGAVGSVSLSSMGDLATDAEPPTDATLIAAQTDAATPIDALRLLKAQAQAALAAELDLLRTIAQTMAVAAQRVTLWGVTAILFAFVGLLALAVGLTIALASYTGPLIAALVIGGALMGFGLFAGLRARRALGLLTRAAESAMP